jgi:hypothetical protein
LYRFDDARMRVTQDQWTPRHAEVEIAVAVFIDRVSAFRLAKKNRRTANLAKGTYRARYARGYQRFSARVELGRACLDEFLRVRRACSPRRLRG